MSLVSALTSRNLPTACLADGLQAFRDMPMDPLSRVSTVKASKDVYKQVMDAVIRYDRERNASSRWIEYECNPFMPPGYAAGFSRGGDMLFIIGPATKEEESA